MLFLSAQHSFAGRKFEHAVKHGAKNGLFVVTLGWLVDCVRRSSKTSAILFCFPVNCGGIVFMLRLFLSQ